MNQTIPVSFYQDEKKPETGLVSKDESAILSD